MGVIGEEESPCKGLVKWGQFQGGGQPYPSNREGFSDCEMVSLDTQGNKWSWWQRGDGVGKDPASVS